MKKYIKCTKCKGLGETKRIRQYIKSNSEYVVCSLCKGTGTMLKKIRRYKMKLDWKKIWKDFDKWYFRKEKKDGDATWTAQAKKIERLVNKEITNN